MATTGPSTTFQRRLVRDGLQTAWGFRLQGGRDFNAPLQVQRVFTGSPAEGELQRGDVIIAINNRDTNTINHKEALEIIKRSGSELLLSVQRGPGGYIPNSPHTPTTPQGGYRPVQFSATGPVPTSPGKTAGHFGVHYGPPSGQQGPMINRVQDSLQHATYNRPEDEEDYDYKTVNQRKAVFQQGGGQARRPIQSRGRKWQPPSGGVGGGGMSFGWSPSVRVDPNYRAGPPEGAHDEYKPVRQAGPSHQPADKRHVAPQAFVSQVEHEKPAWRGSLRKAGSTTPSGSYKSVQFNPNQPAGIRPIQVHQAQPGVNEGPQVVHLQYNSPLGLYSKNSADEALRGQTAGRPGQGTLMITGGDGKQEIDWNKSHVYQMIHGGDHKGPQAARYKEQEGDEYAGHYEGYQDHTRQSRSFQALQHQVGADDDDLGATEF